MGEYAEALGYWEFIIVCAIFAGWGLTIHLIARRKKKVSPLGVILLAFAGLLTVFFFLGSWGW